ncbi:MAG: hypothetical protein ABI862_11000 [Ilumatobacteraceae bacterium]
MRDTRGVKASGLQGDTSVEIIEILDDDTDAFGPRGPNATIHDSGGPRWIGPVAAAALVAIIGYGVATSASTSSTPKVAPVDSTIAAPTTTQPTTTTTIPEQLVPYYSADPPREYAVQYAEVQLEDPGYYGGGGYQLWAAPNSTATSGSWFSVEHYPGGGQSIYAIDAYRIETDQQSIAVSRMPSGQSVLQVTAGRQTATTLTAFGIGDDALIQLAGSITADRGNIEFSDPSLIAGYDMISTVPPWVAVQGNPVEQIYYAVGNNPIRGVGITVSLRHPSSEGSSDLDRQTALRFFLDHSTPVDIDGHVAVAGAVIGQQDYALATWAAGDHIVTVSGTMTVAQLIAIARTVHEVSTQEWSGMQFQAARHSQDNNFGDYEQTDPVPVSFGTDANAEKWVVQVGIATFGNQEQVNWQWDLNSFAAEIDDTAKISTVVDSQRTYVLAVLPRNVAPTAQLQVTRDGLDPVVVPFADTDPTFDRTFAAYAFSEPTGYTAQIIGADGIVLANWPST